MKFLVPFFKNFLFEVLNLSGWKKHVLDRNLEYVFPQKISKERKIFRKRLLQNLSSDAVDFLTGNWTYSSTDSRFCVDKSSLPVLEKMKKGGFLLTAHFENYEILGPWLVRMEIPLVASYAKLKPEWLDKWVHKKYRSVDNIEYSLFINNPKKILNLLDEGKLFCLLADQDFRGSRFTKGSFLGKPVHCNPLPAFILKYRPKTPFYICWNESTKNGKTLFAKEIFVSAGEDIFSNFHGWLEERINLSPEKWYGWVHRRFLSTKNLKYH